MRRVVLLAAAMSLLGLSAGYAWSHDHRGPYGPHHGFYAPAPRPVVAVVPRVVVPVRVAPPMAYPPPYAYYAPSPYPYYYAPAPACGIYYRGRGLSIGVGF